MAVLYKDKTIILDEENITIKEYYFPLGQAKVIPWGDLKAIKCEPLTTLNGKFRVWGMGLKPYWFNNEWRVSKKHMIVLDIGQIIKPTITPDDFEEAKSIFTKKLKLN